MRVNCNNTETPPHTLKMRSTHGNHTFTNNNTSSISYQGDVIDKWVVFMTRSITIVRLVRRRRVVVVVVVVA